ncbi:MAG: hypothetical protein JOZ07_04395 [Solirubrobacterales bacterium]|nr:hypothetical protein [Solirubrobacterales bacterium]
MPRAAERTGVAGDLIRWLSGAWSLRRAINDDPEAFVGEATFTVERDGARWHETGRLRLDGHVGPASRTLLVVPAGDAWAVRFEDDRPFHPLDLRDGRCEVEHPCGADRYLGTYTCLGDDELRVAWRVTGPSRDDTILTHYRRHRASRASVSAQSVTRRAAAPAARR